MEYILFFITVLYQLLFALTVTQSQSTLSEFESPSTKTHYQLVWGLPLVKPLSSYPPLSEHQKYSLELAADHPEVLAPPNSIFIQAAPHWLDRRRPNEDFQLPAVHLDSHPRHHYACTIPSLLVFSYYHWRPVIITRNNAILIFLKKNKYGMCLHLRRKKVSPFRISNYGAPLDIKVTGRLF